MKARRKWFILIGVCVLLFVFFSLRQDWSSCRLCGKSRYRLLFKPVGIPTKDLCLQLEERATPLSTVLEPLREGGVCRHIWVIFRNTTLFRRFILLEALGHSRLEHQYNRAPSSGSLEPLAKRDPELALKVAEVFLYPYGSDSEWERRAGSLRDEGIYFLAHESDAELDRWRERYGLPPKHARPLPKQERAAKGPGNPNVHESKPVK